MNLNIKHFRHLCWN